MLLAASPGGTTANLYSHLAHGDVALNITLTAVNSVIAILTMPLIVNLSLAYFMSADQAIPLQFAKVVQVFAIDGDWKAGIVGLLNAGLGSR